MCVCAEWEAENGWISFTQDWGMRMGGTWVGRQCVGAILLQTHCYLGLGPVALPRGTGGLSKGFDDLRERG